MFFGASIKVFVEYYSGEMIVAGDFKIIESGLFSGHYGYWGEVWGFTYGPDFRQKFIKTMAVDMIQVYGLSYRQLSFMKSRTFIKLVPQCELRKNKWQIGKKEGRNLLQISAIRAPKRMNF